MKKRYIPWILLFCVTLFLILTTCTPPFSAADLEGNGTVLGVPQASESSVDFIPSVKRNFGDPDYPASGLTSVLGSTLGLTGDSNGSNPTFTDNGDGTVSLTGKIFIETGAFDGSSFDGVPIALNGADLTIDESGNIEGSAELPVPAEGPFKGWSWEASTLARVMKMIGSEIKALLDENDEDPLPLQDDRIYLVFILDGNITALGSDALEFELPEIPNVPSAGIRMVLDVTDPMFYFDFSADEGILEEDPDSGDGEKSEESQNDNESKDNETNDNESKDGTGKKKRNPVLRGFSKFAELDGMGFGFSTKGLIPLERDILWPFNSDLERDFQNAPDMHLRTDMLGNLLPAADRIANGYEEDEMTFGAGGSFQFLYGDQTEAVYPSPGDSEPDEIPIRLDSHIYLKGSVDLLEVMGIPLEVDGDGAFNLDPTGSLGSSLRAGQPDVPFRVGLNGELVISDLGFLDNFPFITVPSLGYASLMAEHSSLHNRAYFSAVLGDKDLTIGDFFDFTALGDIPGAGFLDSFDTDFLSEVCLPVTGEANFSGYFQAPPDIFQFEFRFNSVFALNFSSLVNSVFSHPLFPEAGLDFTGDFLIGYPKGLFWKGYMALDSEFMGLSMDGNTIFQGWLAAADNWGLGFAGMLSIDLIPGLGSINLAAAELNIETTGIDFGGQFGVPGFMPSLNVSGNIYFDPFDFLLEGAADISILGIPLVGALVEIGYSTGVFIEGTARIPGFSDISLSGSFNPATEQFALSGSADIQLGTDFLTIAGADVTLSNSGLFLSGTLKIPGVSEIRAGGQIKVIDGTVFYEFTGYGDIEIYGYNISSAEVRVDNDGIYINGGLYLEFGSQEILEAEISGYINNSKEVALKGRGDVAIGGVTLAAADIMLFGSLDDTSLAVSVKSTFNLYDLATIETTGDLGLTPGGSPPYYAEISGSFYASGGAGWSFEVLDYNFELGVSASATITMTIGLDTFNTTMSGRLDWKHPWAELKKGEECGTVLGVTVCVPYWYPSLSTKTGGFGLSGDAEVDSSGLKLQFTAPLVGTKSFRIGL